LPICVRLLATGRSTAGETIDGYNPAPSKAKDTTL
jgi:hypothetical protein